MNDSDLHDATTFSKAHKNNQRNNQSNSLDPPSRPPSSRCYCIWW